MTGRSGHTDGPAEEQQRSLFAPFDPRSLLLGAPYSGCDMGRRPNVARDVNRPGNHRTMLPSGRRGLPAEEDSPDGNDR
jgi:hypothetical protein